MNRNKNALNRKSIAMFFRSFFRDKFISLWFNFECDWIWRWNEMCCSIGRKHPLRKNDTSFVHLKMISHLDQPPSSPLSSKSRHNGIIEKDREKRDSPSRLDLFICTLIITFARKYFRSIGGTVRGIIINAHYIQFERIWVQLISHFNCVCAR